MSKNDSNPVGSIVGFAAVVAGVAAGVWLFKNREKIPEWKQEAEKWQGKAEEWQKQMQKDWLKKQRDLEKWKEDWQQDPAKQAIKALSKARNFVEDKVDEARIYVEKQSKESVKPAAKIVAKAKSKAKATVSFDLNERQEAIYQIVKKEAQASMNTFAGKVAGVTTRTLRRDLTKLEKLGLIEQVGKTKDSFYRVRK